MSTNPAPWGGSEDMWHALAHRALRDGHRVMISVFRHPEIHPKLLELMNAGAILHSRALPAYYDHQPFARWMLAHLKLRLQWESYPFTWRKAIAFRPDHIFISGGETLDGCMFAETYLIRQAIAQAIPYTVVGHFHHEYSKVISQTDRASKRQYLQHAAGTYFVSYRNWQMTANEIQDELADARIVFNPIRNIPERKRKIHPQGTIRMAFVARLEATIKCQDLAINTLAQDIFKNTDFILDIYGEGPDKAYLAELVRFHGLENKIRLKGQHPSPEDIWEDHDLLVLTSRGEGAPLVILEAMRAGIPCLVTKAGDSALWINDERGFVSESISIDTLTATFLKAFNDRSHWDDKGHRCRRFFDAVWTSEHMDQLYSVINGAQIKAGIPVAWFPEWITTGASHIEI